MRNFSYDVDVDGYLVRGEREENADAAKWSGSYIEIPGPHEESSLGHFGEH